MPEGMSLIERRIEQFEQALEEMRQATSECHSMLKKLRDKQRAIETLLKGDTLQQEVTARVETIIDQLDVWPMFTLKLKAVLLDELRKDLPPGLLDAD